MATAENGLWIWTSFYYFDLSDAKSLQGEGGQCLSVLFEASNDPHVVQTRYEVFKMKPALYFKEKDTNRSQCHEDSVKNRDLTERGEMYKQITI